MKETILLINFNDTARRNQVKRALMPLRLRLKSVGPDQYDLPVGVLAGEKQTDQREGKIEGAGREDLSAKPSIGSSDGRGEPCETAAEAPPDEREVLSETAAKDKTAEDLAEELFVMAGLSGGRVDAVLAALRKAGIRIPYKAVMTATNQDWDVRKLYREIRSEHEAMTGKGRG
jgi:hypothetical protein